MLKMEQQARKIASMNQNMNTHNPFLLDRDETLYIGDVVSVEELVSVITEYCRLCPLDLQVTNTAKAGHVLMLNYRCENGNEVKWISSSVCGENYKNNYR